MIAGSGGPNTRIPSGSSHPNPLSQGESCGGLLSVEERYIRTRERGGLLSKLRARPALLAAHLAHGCRGRE